MTTENADHTRLSEVELHDQLWEGIITQNEDKIRECIEKGAMASYKWDNDGSTLLHIAARIGNVKILEILLTTNCDIDAGNGTGVGTALHFAVNAHGDNVDACKVLIKFKAEVDVTNKDRRTPLHDACKLEKLKVAKLLVDKGASVVATDLYKRTPLHEVCQTGNEELCQLLISKGAQVSAVDMRGRSSLHVASAAGHKALCVILLNAQAEPECQDLDGRTPLHCASRADQADICELLLDHGAGLETKDKRGRTALYFAIATGSEAVCLFLRSRRASISHQAAVKMCRVRRKPLIIKEDAEEDGVEKSKRVKLKDPQTLPHDGRTLLHIVAACGGAKKNNGNIAWMVYDGMDYSATVGTDLKGRTAYYIAAGRANTKLLEVLPLSHHDNDQNDKTPLHSAAMRGHLGNCKKLLKLNPSGINAIDKDRNTPLHCATARGHNKVCELLISRREVDVHHQNKYGEIALHLAAARGDKDICKRLIKKGGRYMVTEVDMKNRTPLHVSAYHNNRAASQCLISAGARVNVKDQSDNTPLHSAARSHGDSMCSILIKKKASVLKRNKVGDSPLDLWPEELKSNAVSLSSEVKKQSKAELAKTGTKQIEVVKLFLLGDPKAGKTTLKKSLSEKVMSDDMQNPNPHHTHTTSASPPSDDYYPTAGIEIGRQAIGSEGDFCVWDCAGHIEFHVTHNMFLGAENSIFTVAYDLSDDTCYHLEKLKYWLSFIKAGHDYSDSSSPIPVVQIVATHVDMLDNQQEGRACAKSTLDYLIKLYKNDLVIHDNLIVVDSREATFPDMILLREKLHSIASQIKGSTMVPVVCEEVSVRKDDWCLQTPYYECPVINWKYFLQGLNDIKLLRDNTSLLNVVDYLHNIGEIYRSKKIHGRYKVVLKPSWLCSTVIGPTFAGRNFPVSMAHLKDKPFFTVSDLQGIFPSTINSNLLVEFLQDLNLAFRFEEDKFIIPARLPVNEGTGAAMARDAKGDVKWNPDSNSEYHGISFQCVDETDMFTADVFPSLQVQIMKKYKKKKKGQTKLVLNTRIANGVVEFFDKVKGMVELDKPNKAILIAVGSKRGDNKERVQGFKALKEVEVLAQSVLKERSPGTKVAKRYLSPSYLARKEPLQTVVSYSEADIDDAYESDGMVTSSEGCDKLTDVLYCGHDPIFLWKHAWECDLLWLPLKVTNLSVGVKEKKKDIEVGQAVYKNLDREDYRTLAEIIKDLLDHEDRSDDEEMVEKDDHVLRKVVEQCRALRSSISATLVNDFWPKRSKFPRTVAGLYSLLKDGSLIGNQQAAEKLKQTMKLSMENFDIELPEVVLPSTECINIKSNLISGPDSENYVKVCEAIHTLCHLSVPTVQECVQKWHHQQKQRIHQPCLAAPNCLPNKKPTVKSGACQSCIDWTKSVLSVCHPLGKDIEWRNVNATLFHKDPVEVAKGFLFLVPQGQSCTTFGDFDVGGILKLMMGFRDWHNGDQACYVQLQKVLGIRNSLSHMSVNENMCIPHNQLGIYFDTIESLVNTLKIHQPTLQADDIKTRLNMIRRSKITTEMKERALCPLSDSLIQALYDGMRENRANLEDHEQRLAYLEKKASTDSP